MTRQSLFILASFFVFVFSQGCKKNEADSILSLIDRPIAPIQLDAEQTLIYLDDFLTDSVFADSVLIDNKKVDFYQNNKTILYRIDEKKPIKPLILLKIWSEGKSADIILKRSERINYLFLFDSKGEKYESVQLKGNFNGWVASETVLTQENGIWGVLLKLNRGKYEYLVVANGKEMTDPNNLATIDNGQGGKNSVLTIGSQSGSEPLMWTESIENEEILIKVKNNPEKIFVLWNNILLDSNFVRREDSKLKIKVPNFAKGIEKSTIRVFSFNKEGAGNDIYIPLRKGNVQIKPDLTDRFDHHQKIIYNVFMDRFVDGNTKNNRKLPDSLVLPAANYHGGDIAGMRKKIEDGYFKDLGINTLWISPIVKNTENAYGFWPEPKTKFSAYHGYWPVSFTQIDNHFATAEEFKAAIEIAHKNNINILADYVANHIHEEHPYYKSNPKCATELMLPDGRMNLELWDEHRLTTWFDKFLPTLDLENNKIAEMVVDSVVWWAQEYNLDGFRYDAAKHVPLTFWRLLTDKLNDKITAVQNGNFYQLGETYGSSSLISSYLGNGLLDAQFDFNMYDASVGAFAKGSNLNGLADKMNESLRYYGSHHLMGNITGNQDRGRFISYAGGSLLFNEDAKKAGWTRKIEVGDKIGYQKLSMLLAFNMTIPGAPVIYYGDEFGMPGGNDPDCRRMMRFGEELNEDEKKSLQITKELINIRRNSMALIYGDFCYQKSDINTLVFARKYFSDLAIMAFNNSMEEKTIEINISEFSDNQIFKAYPNMDFVTKNNTIILILKPWSFVILRNN
jgi:cyclomaltodextrinase / maltogenic alpha-amylase / neopullulanase